MATNTVVIAAKLLSNSAHYKVNIKQNQKLGIKLKLNTNIYLFNLKEITK